MSDSYYDPWPDYLPGPRDDLLALGVVSLNYGYLENIFRLVFSMVTGMSSSQVGAIFERLNNDARLKVLDQLLKEQPYSAGLKDVIEHFADGFNICAQNRHAIMHSHLGGIHSGERGTQGIVLQKHSRAGERSLCFANTPVLRKVADDINAQANFGTQVMMTILNCQGVEDVLQTLPCKPALPETLNWSAAPTFPAPKPPPESSQA